MDSHAFASLAHLRILLVPVGSILQSTFDKFAAEIRAFDEIPLRDVPSDQKDEKARFMPAGPMASGCLHLSFPSHPPPLTHSDLSLFRPSHFPLGVVGIGVCSQTDALPSLRDQFHASMLDMFPAGSTFPLARNCFVFEEGEEESSSNLSDNLPGLVVIPSIMGNKKIYIGTLLADLCSHILGELGRVVSTLESPLGNEFLNATLFPVLPPSSEMPFQLNHGPTSSFLSPHNSQPDLDISAQQIRAHTLPNLHRNASAGPGLSSGATASTVRQSTLGAPLSRDRRSGIGASSPPGRLFKVLGDFFLLSGKMEDASMWYAEAIFLFKSSLDTIWHASALEGLATVAVLDAWSAGQGLAGSVSGAREPWADISEKLTQAVALYHKATLPTSDIEKNHFYASYLYSTAAIRHASLFFSVWSAKGWGPLAFTTMLQPGALPYLPPTLAHGEHESWIKLERLSSVSGIPRSTIAGLVGQAHGPWLLHLGPRERLGVLETMAGMYACLGYKRKEAYVLREILGCIMDLLVCGRDENRDSQRGSNTNGLGLRGASLDKGNPVEHGNVSMRQNDNAEGNESILKLLRYVCRVLGIDLEAVKLVAAERKSMQGAEVDEESQDTSLLSETEDDMSDQSRDVYGWPELQVGVVREAIAIAEALPDYPAVAQIALSALKTMHSVLAADDQSHLYQTSGRALATAQRRGDSKQIEYWAGQPVVSITLSPLPTVRLPTEKSTSVLTARMTGINPVLTGAKDPFLYNPRKSLTAQGTALVVESELLELVVMLRNPFIFDLELQSLRLSTSGVPFETKSVPIVIPARSYHPVNISGTPTGIGTLVIRGCIVRAPGGASREFILPLSTDEEEERISRRRSAFVCETGRSKYTGLESRPRAKSRNRISTTVPSKKKVSRFLELKVIPEQPLLRIRRTSLTHGAVMMYNGENSIIRLTIENISDLPIDFLRLSFEDSTMAPAQHALADGEMSVFETYETEYDLIHKPTFTWLNRKELKQALPGQKAIITVGCFGKVGCTSGFIHMAYSYVQRPSDESKAVDIFHTRQLTYPVLVTVYHMLECYGMDILPFDSIGSGVEPGKDKNSINGDIRRLVLDIDDDPSWCLFSIDVRNTYGLPFEVTFERNQEGTPSECATLVVAPGSTSRIVLPVKKFVLREDHTSQPIPTLSDRQFVVNKSKLSPIDEKNQRELFWYREELIKYIRGRWREAGGTRHGELSLREQRMTLPMLELLRTDRARVTMSLISHDNEPSSKPIFESGGKYFPAPHEFVILRTRVCNLSLSPMTLLIDIELDPIEYIIYEGVLSNIPLGILESGESREVEMVVVFLAYGQYSIRGILRTIGTTSAQPSVGIGHLRVLVQDGL